MEIPQLSRLQAFRNAMRYADNPLPGMDANLQKMGPTFRGYIGGIYPSIVTTDPELTRYVLQKNHRNYHKSFLHFKKISDYLGNGLLTSDGDYWLQQRRLIQPGFHKAQLEALTEIMLDVIDDFLQVFAKKVENGPVDVYQEMMELAFNIICRAIFGKQVNAEDLRELSDNLTEIQAFIVKEIRQPYLQPWLRWTGQIQQHRELAARSEAIILKYIHERKNSTQRGNDLLQMLLDVRYQDSGEGMTERQLVDEINILLEAGHETSANALCWIWHLLSQHPDVAQKARNEARDVLGDRKPTFADLHGLMYTKQVIQEGMRLYPPVWVTNRMAAEDDQFQNLHIAKGTIMVLYFYGVHHRPDFWPEPNRFNPDRFAPGQNLPHPYAYIPFGGGPRLCIGNNFALMEMQLVLAEMLRRYEVQAVPGQEVMPWPLLALRPKTQLMVKFEKATTFKK